MDFDANRRTFLAGLTGTLAFGLSGSAGALEQSLRPVARPAGLFKAAIPDGDALINRTGLQGTVSYCLRDAETGVILEARTPDTPLPPASVAKALTTVYALHHLGAGHRFSTTVMATGPVQNGVVQGDLILTGGGDPTLNSDDLAGLAATLAEQGVTGLTGAFALDQSALPALPYIDAGQPAQFGYNPAISGLNLNYNRVYFEWARQGRSYRIAMEARTNHRSPATAVAQMRLVERAAPVYTYTRMPAADQWTVARSALGKGGGRWLPVRHPARYAGDIFAQIARSKGLRLPNPTLLTTAQTGTVLAQHNSPALPEVLRGMLKYSTNLTAETLGLTISGSADLPKSSALMNDWLHQTYGTTATTLVDHSGLGGASRTTVRDLCAIFRAEQAGQLPELMKPIKMRKDLPAWATPAHAQQVAAKTGTLDFVSTLGGYLTAANGRKMIFAIQTADLERRAAISPDDRERPAGSKTWNRRSQHLKQLLLARWGVLYGT